MESIVHGMQGLKKEEGKETYKVRVDSYEKKLDVLDEKEAVV